MTTLITRLFANNGTASDAASALQSNGFAEEAVGVISGSETDARAAMAEVGVGDKAADAYARGIADGNTLVALRAPFGTAGRAITALKKFESIDVGLEEEDNYVGYKTDAAYQTNIIRGGKKFLTGKGVTEPRTYFTPFGIPLLSKNQRGRASVGTSTMSSKFGMPTIKQPSGKKSVMSDNRTPFSSLFGMATIKKPRDRKSVTTGNPTPFSSAMGWPTLSDSD